TAVATRIRKRVEGLKVQTDHGGQVAASISLGASSYPEDGKSEWELVHAADQRAYEDKRSRRTPPLMESIR
ncbi:MAG TPA: diguanylate cyclase, partial [Chloroflexota bacterium]|nr:diguanylate cyclase [Chloroflexota bacterium]